MRKTTTVRPPASPAQETPFPPPRWRRLVQGAVLVAAVIFVFGPAIHGGWLWDDNTEITQNLDLRNSSGGLAKIWTAPASPDYFPLKTTVQWLQWQLWTDRSTTGYHFTNIALHLLSAFLLWRVFAKLGLRFAWVGACLFAVHPLAVESVVWIAELKNALSLPLVLLAMGAYVDFDQKRRRVDYFQAVAWFLAAMLCKSSVVMFPCVALLYVWWRRSRLVWRDLLSTLPLFGISALLGVVTLWFQHHRAIGTSDVGSESLFARLVNAGSAIGFYLWKSLLPFGLSPVYPRWSIEPLTWWQFLAWPILVAGFVFCWRHRARWGKTAIFGFGFFILNLLPVLGVVPMSYLQIAWVADHFVYLSVIGWAGLAAAGVGFLIEKIPSTLRPISWIAVSAVALLFAIVGRLYAENFESAERLWSHTLQRYPSAWLAQNNYGAILLQRGQNAEALLYLQKAVELNPRYASARVNLGNAFAQLRRPDEALAQYTEALRIEPDSPEAQFNLGNLFVQLGRLPEAITHYEQALRNGPASVDILYNLANALAQSERLDEAMTRYGEALRLNPNSFEVHFNFGNVLAAAGHFADATEHFKKAVQLLPSSADAHSALGELLAQAGDLPSAVREFEEALRLKPGDPEILANLQQARGQRPMPSFGR